MALSVCQGILGELVVSIPTTNVNGDKRPPRWGFAGGRLPSSSAGSVP